MSNELTGLQSQRVVLERGTELEVVPARIILDGRIIRSVERLDSTNERPPAGIIDLGSQLISPAFINAHTHLSMSMFRGIQSPDQLQSNVVEDLYFKVEQHVQPEDIKAFTRMGAYESLLAGVGCVWDHYYGHQAVVDALKETGLCAVFAPTLQDQGGPGAERSRATLEFTRNLAHDTSAHDAGIVAALGPHATDTVSPQLWSEVARLADEENLPVHVHVAQSVEELERSHKEMGCSPIGKLQRTGLLDTRAPVLLVHSLFVTHEDVDQLNSDRHILVYCPFSQIQFDYPAQLESWLAAGMKFALGTDCGACNDSMSVQQELRLAAGSHAFKTTWGNEHTRFRTTGDPQAARGVAEARRRRFARNMELNDPSVLLRSIWQTPGELHTQLPLGRIAPGYVANLAVWNMEHPAFWPDRDPLRALAFGDVGGALDGLLVNGQWISERGNHARSILESDGYKAAKEEATARLEKLRQRID
jgi:5-methylthioadenosine/S-adenosylhomocysteine deaminase